MADPNNPNNLPQLNSPTTTSSSTTSSTGSTIMYPSDLQQNYYTQIQFVRYNRPTSLSSATATVTNMGSPIFLPLPMQIIEAYNIQYNAMNIGNLATSLTEPLLTALQNDFDVGKGVGGVPAAISVAQNIWGSMTSGIGAAWKDFVQYDKAGNLDKENLIKKLYAYSPSAFFDTGFGAQIAATTGYIPNPHTANIFKNVSLRSFPLNWIFSPRSQQDSQTLEQILTTFKTRAHPRLDFNNLFLDYPDQAFVSFTPNTYMMPSKRSVITSLTINKSPNSRPAFYTGGAPVEYHVEMVMSEVEIRTQADFVGTISFVS